MADQFFTPKAVAEALIAASRRRRQVIVADFSAGDGELLRAAEKRWPSARMVATDVDPKCVGRLKKQHQGWSIGTCDFLSGRSKARSQVLRDSLGSVSLAVLNPPFSCRGASYVTAQIGDRPLSCSRSMAFVLGCLPYLASRGEILALLPEASLRSTKDALAWDVLGSIFSIRTVASFGRRTFRGCSASTMIVALERKGAALAQGGSPLPAFECDGVQIEVVRGVVPMHEATNGMAGGPYEFVHTTEVRGGLFDASPRRIRQLRRFATGPGVLLPRVGEPTPSKCALYLRSDRIVLSDCLYCLQCGTEAEARLVRSRILDAWGLVSGAYGGTCARYLTVTSLLEVLRKLGFHARAECKRS